MRIKKIVDKLDDLDGEKREYYLSRLAVVLTTSSKNSLMNFQRNFLEREENPHDYEKFKKEQNKVIRECIKMETSEIGKDRRHRAGKRTFLLDIEIPEFPWVVINNNHIIF